MLESLFFFKRFFLPDRLRIKPFSNKNLNSFLSRLSFPAGFEATKRTIYGGQREADGGQLYQSQLDRTELTENQVKDSLMLFLLIVPIMFIALLPTCCPVLELWN